MMRQGAGTCGGASTLRLARPGRLSWSVVAALGCLLSSCGQPTTPQPPVAPLPPRDLTEAQETPAVPEAPLIPAGDPVAEQIEYEFAIYYLTPPAGDPLPELKSLLASKYPLFTFREATPGDESKPQEVRVPGAPVVPAETEPTVTCRVERDVPNEYTPPDGEHLARFGHGLSDAQIEQLGDSKEALILRFSYRRKHVWEGLRAAQELMAELAVASGGLIWDESTRQVFAADAWKKRLAEWTEGVPDVSRHTVIHAYKSDDYLRAITLGLGKFGLPDVVVEGFSPSQTRNTGNLINLFAQALAEGGTIGDAGQFDLDFKAIRSPQVREKHLSKLRENATGLALLTLRQGTWEEGDPENRLIELSFDRGTGPDSSSRLEGTLASAFGFVDEVTRIKHNAELEAASERARKKLPDLERTFNKGLEPGETLLLKAPFKTPDEGREWMWVEVVRWKGDAISGLLMNEPHDIPELHAGQEVEVSQGDIFDYIRRHPDGTMEGNETGKIIGRQTGE